MTRSRDPSFSIMAAKSTSWLLATALSFFSNFSVLTPALLIFSVNELHFEESTSNFLNGFVTSAPLRAFVAAEEIAVIPLVNVCANGSITLFTSLIFSLNTLKNCTNGPFCTTSGETNSAPILAREARTLDIAPVNVSFAFLACSPNALSIAAAKVLKLISPLLTISRTCDSVTFAPFPVFVR